MGRNYYCEYCNKILKNDVNIRKKHIKGIPHSIAKAGYQQQFRDPEEILLEELNKRQCGRFLNGKECKFGFVCHFSHYNQNQLNQLQKIVNNRKALKAEQQSLLERQQIEKDASKKRQKSHGMNLSSLYEDMDNVVIQNFWNYPFDQNRQIPIDNIPLSVQSINIEKIPQKLYDWGT